MSIKNTSKRVSKQLTLLPLTSSRRSPDDIDNIPQPHNLFVYTLIRANHNVDLDKVQDIIYQGILGHTEDELRAIYGADKKTNLRNQCLPYLMLIHVVLAEEMLRLHINNVLQQGSGFSEEGLYRQVEIVAQRVYDRYVDSILDFTETDPITGYHKGD